MAGQSAKNKKIDIVMDEFGKGTLRSGKSDKRVTNPKQAIAIALSEAERLAHGGYIGEPVMNQYMNRPMFQTPQMREGGGIMAGIAPIRGYHGGDLVETDMVEEQIIEGGDREDRLMNALSALGTSAYDSSADFFSDAGDLAESGVEGIASLIGMPIEMVGDAYEEYAPEELQAVTDILGEYLPDADDYFEEDFIDFSPSEYKLGTGEEKMNLRDLTDILYDPSSVLDNALLGAATTGVGAPAALLAKIGKSGVTGSKILNRLLSASGAASRKALPQGTLERLGRMQVASGVGSGISAIPKGFAEGYNEVEEMDNYANGGIVNLGVGGFLGNILNPVGRFFGNKLGKIFKGDRGKLDDLEAPKPVATRKGKKGKGEEEEEVTTTTTVTDDVIEESMGMPKKRSGLKTLAKYGVGGAGLYWIGNKLFDEETNEEVDQTKLAPENIPPKPQVIDSSVMNTEEDVQNFADELTEENRSWVDKTFSRLRGGLGKAWDSLDDPRTRAAIMAASKPVEGYTPINALVAASEGARQYDLEQAQLTKLSEDAKSDLQKQFELIRPLVQPYEGQSEEDVDRMVFQSLFSRVRDAEDIETLIKLNATFPNANINIDDLKKYRQALGGLDISSILGPRNP